MKNDKCSFCEKESVMGLIKKEYSVYKCEDHCDIKQYKKDFIYGHNILDVEYGSEQAMGLLKS